MFRSLRTPEVLLTTLLAAGILAITMVWSAKTAPNT